MTIADQLLTARVQANLTQAELARRSVVNVEVIGETERRRNTPSVRTLEKLADALGVVFTIGGAK
jgi:transcriptional regulator with XRE-family HTH domain